MRLWISRIKIAKGSNSIDMARASRASESSTINQVLRLLRRELDKIAQRRKSQPYLIFHISEGATSLSVAEAWLPRICDEVSARRGYMVIILNVGKSIRSLGEEEFKKRMEVTREILRARVAPVILTTNCLRSNNSVVFDESAFDPKYALLAYAIDRCAVGKPLRDDLSNLLRPGTIHAVTTPVRAWSYSDFIKTHVSNVSFMFAGDLGAGKPAPPLLEAKDKVDGMVIVGHSEGYLEEVVKAFSHEWPGRQVAAYAMGPAREESSRLFPLLRLIPRVREPEAPRGWAQESFLVVFTASITAEEAERAIEAARKIEAPQERSGATKVAGERPRVAT